MINNRIEEVKKILSKLLNDCQRGLTKFSRQRIGDDARQICQLFPQPDYIKLSHEANMSYGVSKSQPLEVEELRRGIEKILIEETGFNTHYMGLYRTITDKNMPKILDQILALLQPKIEEAGRQERERITKWGNEPCPHAKIFTTKIGTPYSTKYKRECSECWQALKGGE